MKKVALYPNLQKSHATPISAGITEYLQQRGIDVITITCFEDISKSKETIDLVITLGGDGTILRFAQNFPDIEAPIIGVNLGGVGFMADIPVEEIYPTLDILLEGKYSVHPRMKMRASMADMSAFAINEVVVHRAQNPCLVDIVIHVDGVYLNTFSADGIIISTPSGSTAYSLAAGGPILLPDMDCFVITPISPHTISNRPVVIKPESEIQLQYISNYNPLEVTFDGFSHFMMKTGEVLHVTKDPHPFNLVHLSGHDYFHTLRKKLGWTGKLKH